MYLLLTESVCKAIIMFVGVFALHKLGVLLLFVERMPKYHPDLKDLAHAYLPTIIQPKETISYYVKSLHVF
jgi:hypothetical protein